MSINHFNVNSRYYGLETAEFENREGESILYIRRRFVPPAERFETIQTHAVTQGERPDSIAAKYLGDPEQFWRLCDGNDVMRPNELTEEIGRQLRITLPNGIPGGFNA